MVIRNVIILYTIVFLVEQIDQEISKIPVRKPRRDPDKQFHKTYATAAGTLFTISKWTDKGSIRQSLFGSRGMSEDWTC
jgi:hypothetical protein